MHIGRLLPLLSVPISKGVLEASYDTVVNDVGSKEAVSC